MAVALLSAVSAARADELIFGFDGDILPGDPGSDWIIANACAMGCSRRLENGHFLLERGVIGDLVKYSHTIASPGEPPPSTLWVERRFRSDQP